MTIHRQTLALIAALALTGAGVTPTYATVTNLRSLAMRTADVPTSFSHSHVKLYSHFTAIMHVKVSTGMAKNQVSCALPKVFQGEGWQTGLIQAFDRNRPAESLELCASMFGTSAQAHRAYGQIVAAQLRPLIALKQAMNLVTGHIGDEAAGTERTSKVCSCSNVSMHTYEVVFRHDNVVANVSISSGPSFSAADFLHLIAGVNNRLH